MTSSDRTGAIDPAHLTERQSPLWYRGHRAACGADLNRVPSCGRRLREKEDWVTRAS